MHRNNGDRDMCQDYFQYVDSYTSDAPVGSSIQRLDGP